MFRAKDRAQLDLLKAQLDAIQSHMAGCTTMGLSTQLKQIEDRLPTKLFSEFASFAAWAERIEQGQSVLKADLDALAADKAERTAWLDNQLAEMQDSAAADALQISKLLELTNNRLKSLESSAKSAKKRSKKP